MSDDKRNDLSRIYGEGSWPEPRRQIDDAILQAARRAARARHPLLYRFAPPFALAATVVLAFTVAVFVSENESGREVRGLFRFSEPDAGRPAAPPAAKKAEPAPAPAQPKPNAAESKPPAPQPPAKRAAPGLAGPGYAAKAPSTSRAQPPVVRRPDAPPEPERADRVRRDLDRLDETRRARDAAVPQPIQREPAAPADVSSLQGPRVTSAAVARSPEAWLEDIRRLKAEGRADEAARELAEFRKRYPDYRMPDDLH
jgi:hypothetical protein